MFQPTIPSREAGGGNRNTPRWPPAFPQNVSNHATSVNAIPIPSDRSGREASVPIADRHNPQPSEANRASNNDQAHHPLFGRPSMGSNMPQVVIPLANARPTNDRSTIFKKDHDSEGKNSLDGRPPITQSASAGSDRPARPNNEMRPPLIPSAPRALLDSYRPRGKPPPLAMSDPVPMSREEHFKVQRERFGKIPCPRYMKGHCEYGSRCWNLHNPAFWPKSGARSENMQGPLFTTPSTGSSSQTIPVPVPTLTPVPFTRTPTPVSTTATAFDEVESTPAMPTPVPATSALPKSVAPPTEEPHAAVSRKTDLFGRKDWSSSIDSDSDSDSSDSLSDSESEDRVKIKREAFPSAPVSLVTPKATKTVKQKKTEKCLQPKHDISRQRKSASPGNTTTNPGHSRRLRIEEQPADYDDGTMPKPFRAKTPVHSVGSSESILKGPETRSRRKSRRDAESAAPAAESEADDVAPVDSRLRKKSKGKEKASGRHNSTESDKVGAEEDSNRSTEPKKNKKQKTQGDREAKLQEQEYDAEASDAAPPAKEKKKKSRRSKRATPEEQEDEASGDSVSAAAPLERDRRSKRKRRASVSVPDGNEEQPDGEPSTKELKAKKRRKKDREAVTEDVEMELEPAYKEDNVEEDDKKEDKKRRQSAPPVATETKEAEEEVPATSTGSAGRRKDKRRRTGEFASAANVDGHTEDAIKEEPVHEGRWLRDRHREPVKPKTKGVERSTDHTTHSDAAVTPGPSTRFKKGHPRQGVDLRVTTVSEFETLTFFSDVPRKGGLPHAIVGHATSMLKMVRDMGLGGNPPPAVQNALGTAIDTLEQAFPQSKGLFFDSQKVPMAFTNSSKKTPDKQDKWEVRYKFRNSKR